MAASSWLPQTDTRSLGVSPVQGQGRAPCASRSRPTTSGRAWLVLGAILALGIALRVWILSGPLGEVEADESVVGLMALHIQAGEFPAFYWGQPYLGSLEAYLVAAAFALAGPSNLVLKAVPGLAYLAFVLLVFLGARGDFGDRVALLSALYLALPPSFLAFWSLKARGGYVELLAIGQALIFLAPWAARPGRRLALKFGLAAFIAGLLLWTHVMGLVYVLPVGAYLLLRLGRRLLGAPLLAGLAGGLLGLAPALIYNLRHGWETFASLSGGGSSQQAFQDNLVALAQIGLPVMVGLGQATSSPLLFAQDWPKRPGSWPWVPPLLLTLLIVALIPSLPSGLAPVRRTGERQTTAFFGIAVLVLTPILASLGRFGELVAEPRYALPLYSSVPLFVAALTRRLGRDRRVGATRWVALSRARHAWRLLLGCGVLAINAYSLLTADPRLNLPTTAGASTQATRAELLGYLEAHALHEMYTDYWLAYPLMFESREGVLASVSSGGYNRFAPYAYFVSITERPAFVFVGRSPERTEFETRLRDVGGHAVRESVSIYEVYSGVEPLDRLRP
jgi:hypothetical protein